MTYVPPHSEQSRMYKRVAAGHEPKFGLQTSYSRRDNLKRNIVKREAEFYEPDVLDYKSSYLKLENSWTDVRMMHT